MYAPTTAASTARSPSPNSARRTCTSAPLLGYWYASPASTRPGGATSSRGCAVSTGRVGCPPTPRSNSVPRHRGRRCSTPAPSKSAPQQCCRVGPVRETLAAGLLMASGWTKRAPLVDPFCGSGTIAIEAACMARRIAPGRDRSFALLHWPRAEEVRWERLIAGADDERVERIPTIAGSDISAHAIAAATANAVRAGVADDVQFTVMAADAVRLGARPGWIVTNPPYGERLRASAPAWQQLAALIERSPQWRGAVIAPRRLVDTALRAAQPVEHAHRFAVSNGGIGVELTPFRRAGERPASVVAPAPRIAAPAPPTAGGRNPSRNG